MQYFLEKSKNEKTENNFLNPIITENNKSSNNLNNTDNNKSSINIQIEGIKKTKKDKKEYLDFKNAFNKLKKFLHKKNLMFLCKSCNNYLWSNYPLEDILVFRDQKINCIFNLESICEEQEKEFTNNNFNNNKDNLDLKQIRSFFLTEKSILISEKTEFSRSENSFMDFIFQNLICKKCEKTIGKYIAGVSHNLHVFKNKIFLYEDKITTIRKDKDCLPEKVNFEEFISNDSVFQNILKETNKQMEDTENFMFSFHSFNDIHKCLKDVERYLNNTIEDLDNLKLYHDYLEYMKDKI